MSDALDPKEAKTLGDILALVLDDQDGAASVALDKLRARARGNHVTAGALKNIFSRLGTSVPAQEGQGSDAEETVQEQAVMIRRLQQELRIANLALDTAAEQRAAQEEAAVAQQSRRAVALVAVGATSLLLGAGGMWLLERRRPPPPPRLALPGRVTTPPVPSAAPPAPASPAPAQAAAAPPTATADGRVPVTIVPPVRDPSDTAPPPAYPMEARRRGEEGTVGLLVHIDVEGHVIAIGVTQSAGADLDVAAQQAVREWRFRPEIKDGVAVASQMVLRFTFALQRGVQ